MSRRANSTQRAFSLLESVVVILIIILLASIAIPGWLGRGQEKPKLPEPKPLTEEKRIEGSEETENPEPDTTSREKPPLPESESAAEE